MHNKVVNTWCLWRKLLFEAVMLLLVSIAMLGNETSWWSSRHKCGSQSC